MADKSLVCFGGRDTRFDGQPTPGAVSGERASTSSSIGGVGLKWDVIQPAEGASAGARQDTGSSRECVVSTTPRVGQTFEYAAHAAPHGIPRAAAAAPDPAPHPG